MRFLRLRSPAKLNLCLKVVNKRPDGFHNIRTLFERIDLCDEITFADNHTGKIKVFCDHRDVPTGPKNLVYQVAQIFKQKKGLNRGVNITIRKRIPVAAGLAGGSSNAATALVGLNRLWKLNLSQKQLLQIAGSIGSDVPFFLCDSSWAVGTDRGNRIKKVRIKAKLWHVVVTPRIRMYARDVYKALNLKVSGGEIPPKSGKTPKSQQKPAAPMNLLTKRYDNVTILTRYLKNSNISELSSFLENDLEEAVFRLRPGLQKFKQKLKLLETLGVMVSGSGPSIFIVVKNKLAAKSIADDLKRKYSQVFIARTL